MGKMDEMILVVDRDYLFENESLTFQGVLTSEHVVNHIMRGFKAYKEVRRGDAEEYEGWKQPIPYAVLRRGDEVFVYKRLSGGGEARLHDQLSIGVGGHMNVIYGSSDWDNILKVNLYRELSEELRINLFGVSSSSKIVGLINDDEGDAGLYHIGILFVIDLPSNAEVTVRETKQLEGYWIRTKDLVKEPLFSSLETWSRYAVAVL